MIVNMQLLRELMESHHSDILKVYSLCKCLPFEPSCLLLRHLIPSGRESENKEETLSEQNVKAVQVIHAIDAQQFN